MNLVIKKMSLVDEDVYGKVPLWVYKNITYGENISFVAFDGDEAIGVMILKKSILNEQDMILLYMAVAPEYRKQGVARAMMDVAHNELKDKCNVIYARVIDYSDVAENMYQLLIKNQYLPIAMDGCLAGYYLQDIEDTVLVQHAEQLKVLTDRVHTANSLDNRLLRKLQVKMQEKKVRFDFTKLNSNLCRMYVEKDEIKGFCSGVEMEDGSVLLEELYFNDPSATELGEPALLSSMFQYLCNTMSESSKVFVQTCNNKFYERLFGYIGEPDTRFALQQYAKYMK